MTLTRLQELLEKRHFVVTGEISPPHGTDVSIFTDKVRALRDFCDAINVTDNVRGIPTMSSMVCSHFVLEAGAEPIMQMSARDRNRILIESELYGAYALGIRNVMFITGDHTLLGTHPQAKLVYDVDSIQALGIASHLMTGHDLAGDSLEGRPEFFLGATFNPYADPIELQAWRVEKKHQMGAQFFQTQAVYDVERLREFMHLIRGLDVSVIVGIVPLRGHKMAQFMNERVPGIRIPERILSRLREAGEGLTGQDKREAVRQVGIEIALETIQEVRRIQGVNGIHIMSVGWEDVIPELVKRAGLYPRPR